MHTRKKNRLTEYDYSSCGAYFVTVCTKDMRRLFWQNDVVATTGHPKYELSEYGKIVDDAIQNIGKIYHNITVDKYVVMPNHVHILLSIQADGNGRPIVAPTVSTVINQFKGYVTKRIGFSAWQKSFHDHIIRNERDYGEIWQYINENPIKWENDEYF